MSNSHGRLDELGQLLQEAGTGMLSDLIGQQEVLPFRLIACMDGVVSDPIGLFWGFSELPRLRSVLESSEEWKRVCLASLERLYNNHQVPYEPDSDVISEVGFQEFLDTGHIPDKIKDLVTFLHIAATRAFTIKHYQGGGLDETSLGCLYEIVRTLERIGVLDGRQVGISRVLEEDSSQTFLLSTYAVGAKALAELGLMHQRQGRYEDALHWMARAAFEASYTAERYAEEGENFGFNSESEKLPLQPSLSLTDHLVAKGLDNISPQEITDVFLKLKEIGQVGSWSQVAGDCKVLLESVYLFGAENNSYTRFQGGESEHLTEWTPNLPDNIKNEEGWLLTWAEFWLTARAWASAQLSPSDLMRLHQEEKREAERTRTAQARSDSEERLKSYVFGDDNWAELPRRAKDCLITMDVIWKSPEEVSLDSTLENLRQAIEAMSHHFLWQPYECTMPPDLPDAHIEAPLKGVVRRSGDKGYPELPDCIEALSKSRIFRERFLERRGIEENDVNFLIYELPKSMERLRVSRNDATHKVTVSWDRVEVQKLFNEFLGIGQKGVLPELARIGRQLRQG